MKINIKIINKISSKQIYLIAMLSISSAINLSFALEGLNPVDVAEDNQNVQGFQVIESGAIAKNFRQQPPLIPHKVDKYQIDLKVNQCLRCHDWPYNTQFNAPKISETHFVDLNGKHTDKVSASRWFCHQCHVTQQNAPELVENEFRSTEEK
ncbi:cytochrome c-type protein NapB [Gammaproteobacteria bacterium]|nr:cytochrome c-type protein NapB [Gammaproteobacteria bacterium]